MKKTSPWIITVSFAVTILVGTFVLWLPVSRNGDLSLIDALFTATSATCVTGLSTIDIGTKLTTFGKITLLFLIQAGGLGIMSFSIFFMTIMGLKISFKSQLVVKDSLLGIKRGGIIDFLKRIFLYTFVVEALGAFLLFFSFKSFLPKGSAIFFAIFHSISAFCNAGFSFFSDSFCRFSQDVFFNLVITSLIILGGLGFLALEDILNFFRKEREGKRPYLALHTKMVLTTTSLLLLCGTLLILIIEWRNSFSHFLFGKRVLISFFQSTTARTAGFNTIDLTTLQNGTLFVLIVLMFIGASPGSCGGGIKTTTFSIVIKYIFSFIKGSEGVEMFKRRVPGSIVKKAICITGLSMMVIALSFLLLLFIQGGDERRSFLVFLFETVSAFGTVGLSLGITPKLYSLSKIIIILTMFVGRVGPLTIAVLIGEPKLELYHPEEDVMVG